MPDQINGIQFAGIVCGTLFAIGMVTFLVAWWQLWRSEEPPKWIMGTRGWVGLVNICWSRWVSGRLLCIWNTVYSLNTQSQKNKPIAQPIDVDIKGLGRFNRPIEVLPGKVLTAMTKVTGNKVDLSLTFRVWGELTTYRKRNFILPAMAYTAEDDQCEHLKVATWEWSTHYVAPREDWELGVMGC